jgi:hypothetical protein
VDWRKIQGLGCGLEDDQATDFSFMTIVGGVGGIGNELFDAASHKPYNPSDQRIATNSSGSKLEHFQKLQLLVHIIEASVT